MDDLSDGWCEYSDLPSPLSYKTYSIPIYENGLKTEFTVDGIVGDEKYFKLLEIGNDKKLPLIINTNTKTKTNIKL